MMCLVYYLMMTTKTKEQQKKKKQKTFLENTLFKLQGNSKGPNKLDVAVLKRKLYGLVVEKDDYYFEKEGTQPTGVAVDNLFK